MQQPGPTQRFLSRVKDAFLTNTFVKLTLSGQRVKGADLKNIIITPVMLKNGLMMNFVFRHQTRDITKNHLLEEALQIIGAAMEQDFFNADLFLQDTNVKLLISPSGKAKIRQQNIEPLQPVTLSHDRSKLRLVDPIGNVYLRALGITNAQGEVRHEMKDKYLQINRYIELLEPEIKQLKTGEMLRVADMGSGKGYLTFALYDYLVNRLQTKIEMTGVEFRPALVKASNETAQQCGFKGLRFAEGTIETAEIDNPDILIALHACDTATDEAIFRGIEADARLIVCAPCCHKQIRRDMSTQNALTGILKHGILQERQAELLTDGLRAMIMEAHGYKTRVFEFIATEHTPKNVMIVGRKVKLKAEEKEKHLEKIRQVKELFGVTQHYLEILLGA